MQHLSSLVLSVSLSFGVFALLIAAKTELTNAKKTLSKSARFSRFRVHILQVFNNVTNSFHGD